MNLRPIVSFDEDGDCEALRAHLDGEFADFALARLEGVQMTAVVEHESFEVAKAIEDDLGDLAADFDQIVTRVRQLDRCAVRRGWNGIRISTKTGDAIRDVLDVALQDQDTNGWSAAFAEAAIS